MSDWLLGPLVEVRRSDMVPAFLGGRADRSLSGKRRQLGSLSVPLQSHCGFLGMISFSTKIFLHV